jgi:hypothetical protein
MTFLAFGPVASTEFDLDRSGQFKKKKLLSVHNDTLEPESKKFWFRLVDAYR